MIDITQFNNNFSAHINSDASHLLLKLSQDPAKQVPSKINERRPDGRPMPDVVEDMTSIATIDLQGRENSRFFTADNKFIGLEGESYLESVKLVRTCLTNKTISDKITEKEILQELFWWMRGCYLGIERDTTNFLPHLISRINELTENKVVQVAISYLSVEEPLYVGDVIFDKLSDSEFMSYESQIRSRGDGNSEQRIEQLYKLKERYRVFTFASTTVEGTKDKAIEIARERIERALIVIRFFSISAVNPAIPSYFTISGENDVKISNILIRSIGGFPLVTSSFEEKRSYECKMPSELIQYLHSDDTFIAVSEIMMTEKRLTQLEELLRSCFNLISESLRSSNLELKLVFLLVALELLLSRNETEPITFAIGMRLAFLLEDDPKDIEKRNKIFELFKQMYGMRSRFLHHGKQKVNIESIAQFQSIVLTCLQHVALNRSRFNTKDDLINEIQIRIMS